MSLDFICIGVKKGGTTWLYDQLRQHPDIWMPPIKELYAIGDPVALPRDATRLQERRAEIAKLRDAGAFQNGDVDRAFIDKYLEPNDFSARWYVDLFPATNGRLVGDVDPNAYALYQRQLVDIAQASPRLKFIVIVRNPAVRSWSHLSLGARNFNVSVQNLDEELSDLETEKLIEAYRKGMVHWYSSYHRVLEGLRVGFAPERMLFLSFDELALDPEKLLGRVCQFLGLPPMPLPASAGVKSNAGGGPPLPSKIRRGLEEVHRQDQARALSVLNIGADQLQL